MIKIKMAVMRREAYSQVHIRPESLGLRDGEHQENCKVGPDVMGKSERGEIDRWGGRGQ